MNTSKSLDEILGSHPGLVIGTYMGKPILKSETLKLKAAIVEAVEGLAPKPKDHTEEGINVAEENWRLGYYYGVQDFLQAIKEWQDGR